MRTRGIVLVALCLIATAPAVEAGPGSGASCDVKEEYVTQASLQGDPTQGEAPTVEPGAQRPIECYY